MDPVRRERDIMDRALVTVSSRRAPVGQAGDSDSPVVSGRDDVRSIPGKADGANGPVVVCHDGDFPRRDGREEERAVVPTRGDEAAIGREDGLIRLLLVPGDDSNPGPFDLPDPGRMIVAGGREPLPVRRIAESADDIAESSEDAALAG